MSAGQQKRSWPERAVRGALALAMLLVACSDPDAIGTSSVTELDPPSGSPPAGSATGKRSSPEPPDEQYEDATLILVVRNDEGTKLSDIPLVLRREGVAGSERISTGKGGQVKIVRPPGVYRISIPVGCRARREVNEAEKARVGVIEGRTHRITLTAEARRRFVAGPPLTNDLDAPWPTGRTIELGFKIFDRCKDVEAPGVPFKDLRWRATGSIEVVDGGTMRADRSSMGSVKVRCTGEGDAELWLEDRDDPTDRVDILAFRPPVGFDASVPWCGA